ncbi:MAG: glycosyltransferase family 4 protein [Chloroflexota bacterium]
MTHNVDIKSLRICIPIPDRRQGGMYTFLANWRAWLDQQGVWHTQDTEADYNILFVNAFIVPYHLIAKIKRQRPDVKVVQRIDGSTTDYGRMDDSDDEQARVNMLADLTIMQSEYSRYSTMKKFKLIQRDGPVIYNPVDLQTFHPSNPLPDTTGGAIRVCNVSFSTARKKGTWQFATLAQQHPDITFVLCGNYPDLPDLPNIELLGHLDRAELAQAIRSCHCFIHLSENEACPNVVTEALASGLPVLYIDSGATTELVDHCGFPMTIETFRQQLDLILKQHPHLAMAARQRAEQNFAPEYIFSQYANAILGARRHPLPTLQDFLAASHQGYPVIPYRPRQLYWFAKRWASRNILRRA